MAEEIPTPGLTVTVLVRMEDVTPLMLRNVRDTMDMFQRDRSMASTRDSLVKAATADTKYVAEVKSFYDDNVYYLMVYDVFRDVRMVGAPPSAIGKFGGATDNWMYPRHTKKALTVSIGGYEEGDFAMIMGNPGSTNRYMTSWEVKQTIDVRNKALAEVRGVKLAVWKKHMNASPAVRIKYAAKYAQSSNYWKNSIGQSLALQKLGVVKTKQKEEKAFTDWISEKKERYLKYKDVLPTIERSNNALTPIQVVQYYGTETFFRGMEIMSFGNRYARLRHALERKDTAALNL